MITVTKIFHFSAAHQLPLHKGQCSKLHGHNYKLEVEVVGDTAKKSGVIMDFGDLDQIVHEEIIDLYDHCYINATIENPTAENMLVIFSQNLYDRLLINYGSTIRLKSLTLWETEKCYATWTADN